MCDQNGDNAGTGNVFIGNRSARMIENVNTAFEKNTPKKPRIDTNPTLRAQTQKYKENKENNHERPGVHASEAESREPERAEGSCGSLGFPTANAGIWNACVICMW